MSTCFLTTCQLITATGDCTNYDGIYQEPDDRKFTLVLTNLTIAVRPWKTDFDLVEFSVQFTTTTAQDSITGLKMEWCNLIDSDDYTLGCSDRSRNQHKSSLLAKEPAFNPFVPNSDYY